MQSAINIAHDPNRSDVPSPPSTLPPRAPWLSDLFSSVCLKCSEEFGVFRRRHHCRACGGLFCDSCSEKRVKGVPGYDPANNERVCDICFYNDIAVAVVWNLMFSGWHMKYFDNYADASVCYDSISEYASRVMLKVGSGLVHLSHYKNDKWKQRVMDYAYTQIRKVLPARIPLLWHNNIGTAGRLGGANNFTLTAGSNGSGENVDALSVPATLMRSQYRQWPPGENPNYVQPIPDPPPRATAPPVVDIARSQYPPQQQQQQSAFSHYVGPQSTNGGDTPRGPGAHDIQQSLLVVYRQTDGEATDHTWLYFPFKAKVEIVEEAGRFLRNIPRLSYGGVLDLDGFLHHFLAAPGVQGNAQAFHQLFRSYLDNISTILFIQSRPVGTSSPAGSAIASSTTSSREGGTPPASVGGSNVSNSRFSTTVASVEGTATYNSKLRPALDMLHRSTDAPVVIIDVAGNIVASWRCTSNDNVDALAREAGREVFRQQSLAVLIACGPNDSIVFQDMYTARSHMARYTGHALFAVATNTTSPVLIQRDLYMTKDQALILKNAAVNKTMSLVNRQRMIAVPQTESDASSQLMAQVPECGICFLPYDVTSHKPCLCAKCGNSLCFTCIRSVSLCPFCRLELPINGPWVTNVQLLQLLSGSD